mgnify:FL=1
MKTIKSIEQQGAQGDVLFRRVAAIPKDAAEQGRKKGAPVVVAHSETGHNHIVQADRVRIFGAESSLIAYLSVEEDHADVVHQRPYDTHETIRLGKGLWEIRRQREHTPEGWRRVED